MNPLPPNADELVSAYLDGQAAPHEIDIVESNDDLMARVQSLRELTRGLAAPLTPPSEQKEAHIAAALGAFDELFGTTPAAGNNSAAAAPVLAAVPDPAPVAPEPEQTRSTVTSLATARERRRPRRFNIGVIAAAIAAVLLIGSIAALSGGRSQDTANSSLSDAAVDPSTSDDTSSDDAEAAMDEAMDEAAEVELDAARAAPAEPAPAQAAELYLADEEVAEDAAGDDMAQAEPQADADDDTSADDADTADGAEGESTAGGIEPLVPPFDELLGDFETQDELLLKVEPPTPLEFDARIDQVEPGLFPGCQEFVPELSIIETPTLLGTATLDGERVEVHVLPNENGELSLFIVDAIDCVAITRT